MPARKEPAKPAPRPRARQGGVADQVAEDLKQQILSGTYAPGAKLPSELVLARELRVNRFTVREAMNQLEQLHLIARRPGAGTIVLEYSQHASVDVIEHLVLDRDGRVNADVLANLLESSRILASELAGLAAKRRTEEDVQALRQILDTMRRESNLSRLLWLDFDFHWALTAAARNIVPQLVLNSVRGLLKKYTHLLERLWVNPGTISVGYEHVVEAVAAHEENRARALLEWIWVGREQRFADALEANGSKSAKWGGRAPAAAATPTR